ncbi:MAG: hypothetical protein KKB51_06425 [Candidatus Riflebacteria bacterium]|nr:hypothetical protein [Candidatus Riflebacteria bacterium]
MKNISSPLLPFKLTSTDDKITSNAGLGLFGEFLHSQRFSALINENIMGFTSNHSYKPSEFVVPLLLMQHGGGRYLEDVREIANDEALLKLLGITAVPSSSAIGYYVSRTAGPECNELYRNHAVNGSINSLRSRKGKFPVKSEVGFPCFGRTIY